MRVPVNILGGGERENAVMYATGKSIVEIKFPFCTIYRGK
jgi:hypothetical protein